MQYAGQPLGTETGFVAQSAKGPYLITNWHNVTGRHPATKQPFSSTGGVPDEIVIVHNRLNQLGEWVPRTEKLYANGTPRWTEHPTLGDKADFVAMPLVELPHAIPEGEFQVGVLIPERLVDQKLGALAKELEGWNKIVRGYQEVAGEEEREVTVAALASGSYEVYLPLGIIGAGLLSRTIDKVLEWYLRILEIRKRRLELQNLGAPVAEVNTIKKHERDLLDKEIRCLAGELVKEVHPRVDANRRNELETLLTVSIRQIARFVDKGGSVEVDSTPPGQPEEPPAPPEGENATEEATQEYERLKKDFTRLSSEFEKVFGILKMGTALRHLPERTEPILQLTEGEPEDEPTEPEKPTKKKS